MPSQAYWNEQRKIQGCKKLGITPGQWSYIKRIGSMLCNRYTADCNGEYSHDWQYEKTGNLEKVASKFAHDNKLEIYLQYYPRGATIYLDTQPIPDNNYTKAVCIY
jgi:hypothetical protein